MIHELGCPQFNAVINLSFDKYKTGCAEFYYKFSKGYSNIQYSNIIFILRAKFILPHMNIPSHLYPL
jgi:hypothetical protein